MSNRIRNGLIWTTVSSVSRNVVSLLQIIILTRFLAKSDFGIIAIANMFVAFTSMFLDMGMAAGILHYQEITKKQYASLFWLNVIFGIGLTSVLFVISPLITASYESQDLTNIVQLICFTIFLSSLGMLSRTYSQKKSFFKRMAVIEILGYLLTFSVALVTAVKGFGAYSLAYSTIAGSLLINTIYLVYAVFVDKQISFHFNLADTYSFLKIGIFQVGSSILDFFTRELDIIIISATLGLEFLGIYNIAKRIPVALYSFINPIVGRVFTPLFAEMNKDLKKLKDNYVFLSKSLSWISFPLYLFIAAISPTVITLLFGTDYSDGVPILMIYCLIYAFNGVNGTCGALQVALGRTDIGLKWTVYLIVSTSAVYYVTSIFGITVFLIGIALLVFVNAFFCWYMQFRVMVNITLVEYISIYSRSFIICLILSSLIYIVYPEYSILYSAISFVLYFVVYLVGILKTDDGRDFLVLLKKIGFTHSAMQSLCRK